MVDSKLEDTLRAMVRRYGFGRVSQSLWEMEPSSHRFEHSARSGRRKAPSGNGSVAKPGKRNVRVAAPEYVAKMDVSSGKIPLVAELARRFDDKSFLPTFGDVRNFCQIYGIDEPASKSRSSAIPRIFKFMAAMETDDIRKILDNGTFSGPSRLGPLADAIRRRAGLRALARSPESRQTPTPSSSLPAVEAISSPNSPKEKA